MNNTNEVMEIDLLEIGSMLLRRIWVIVIAVILGALLAGLVTFFLITPQYTSSVKLYVNGGSAASINQDGLSMSDLSVSKSLVDTYITIIQSDTMLNRVIESTDSDLPVAALRQKISASALNSTEVFQVSVVSDDPKESSRIADAIADESVNFIPTIVNGSSVRVLDYSKVPQRSSSPSYSKNIAIGAILGFILACAAIIIAGLMDTRVKYEDDLTALSELPVLGSISHFGSSHGNYGYYRYGNQYAAASASSHSSNDE